MEEWRPIADTGRYEVSSLGNFRRIGSTENIVPTTANGYKRVSYRHNGRACHKRLHRLVAEAFVPNPDPLTKTQVNHLNGKLDNRACNLEWCSPKENMAHWIAMRDRKPPPVRVRITDGIVSEEFDSLNKAARAHGVALSTIWSAMFSGRFRGLRIERVSEPSQESGEEQNERADV